MTTITALPTPPSTSIPATFDTLADAFVAALPQLVTETNILAGEVVADRDSAEASNISAQAQVGLAADQVTLATDQVTLATAQAVLATNAANAAVATIGVSLWTNVAYSAGDVRYSGINFLTYRRKSAGTYNLDPALDATRWTPVVPNPAGTILFTYSSFGGL